MNDGDDALHGDGGLGVSIMLRVLRISIRKALFARKLRELTSLVLIGRMLKMRSFGDAEYKSQEGGREQVFIFKVTLSQAQSQNPPKPKTRHNDCITDLIQYTPQKTLVSSFFSHNDGGSAGCPAQPYT